MNLKLTPNVISLTLESTNNESTPYELHEMTAATRDKYLDSMNARMQVGPDGKAIGVKRFDGLQTELLALCLKQKDGTLVPAKVIQEWPASVVTELYGLAQKANRLNLGEAEADSKKA